MARIGKMDDVADVCLMFHTEKVIDKALKCERLPKVRHNPIENLLPEEVKDRYRFEPQTIYEICNLVRAKLVRKTRRSVALPVLWQVLIALRYLATGSPYSVIADTFKVSKPTVCRCVWAFCSAVTSLSRKFIKMPQTKRAKLNIKRAFYKLGGIPNVTGCVDGSLIKIMRPTDNPHEFICRKGYPALNIQVRST